MADDCRYVCLDCPTSFHSLQLLLDHGTATHNKDAAAKQDTLEMKLDLKEELDAEIEDDDDEMDTSIPNTPSPTGTENSGSMLEDGGTPTLINKNQCRFCGHIFDDQSELSAHYTSAHADRKHYSCPQCPAVFAVKRELATHSRTHQGATPFTCEECGKEFGTRQLLKKHCMWHSGKRNHVCPQCNSAFFQKGHLTQHLMIHRGSRPHVCSLCQKTFIFKFDLNRHMKIHAEKGLPCPNCPQAFARHKQLHDHMIKCKSMLHEASPAAPSTPLPNNERRASMPILSTIQQSLPAPRPVLPFHPSSINLSSFSPEEITRADPLRQPLSVVAPSPQRDEEEPATPSISDSATSSSCPSSPQKTSPILQSRSRSTTPAMHLVVDGGVENKCCSDCERERARARALECEMGVERERLRQARRALEVVGEVVHEVVGQSVLCSPFDPSFALRTRHAFQQIHQALHNATQC
ncbi:unnamed protein product, partial [Mesorhabditis spiculigera]